ncbi:MAG: T9SS type A sorting domain-containing protein [Flavobacterium sp.]|nr:T9SS type A sorting domain-containing protein [Flavobacterium sp.]
MKLIINKICIFLLGFIIVSTSNFIIAQTYKQFPINGEARYPIFDMDVYEDQVAIVGRRNYENILQVYLYKNNQWTSLPITAKVNGIEQNIPYDKTFTRIIPEVKFDANGALWLVGIDGIYKFENEQWIRYTLEGVNEFLTAYLKLVFDKQGNIWVIVSAGFGEGSSIESGRQLYRLENGSFFRYLEHYSIYPYDLPMVNESSFDSKDVKNSGSLENGVIIMGKKMYLEYLEAAKNADFIYSNYDGTYKYYTIPSLEITENRDLQKKLNRIFVDSQNRIFFLMRYDQRFNPNTGSQTACCSGLARLDNMNDWYSYTQENNTPYSQNFSDQHIRYATPVDMCELKNNEYLFVMQNNGDGESKNLQLYKLNSNNKFDTLQWKTYLQHATIFRPDYSIISEENLKKEIDILMNGDPVQSKLEIKRMLADKYGNIWIAGENFIIKMTDDPTTSVLESIKKPTIIYPNPGNKSIRLSNNANEIVKIDIISLLGENVLSIQKDFESINVSSLPNGFYMVKIKRMDGSIENVKYNKN